MSSTEVSIPGYIVREQLYDGSRTLVYRGVKKSDNQPVVIKLLKNPYPNFSELVQFRNQYTTAKNLNNSGIIQTYSLEPFQNRYILVMEDFGGVSLKDYFAKNRVKLVAEFLEVAIALCNILEVLYHEHIIHKDIKPSNILINPETKQVKLIDFSIASLLTRETQNLINPKVLEGTLAYISPEQTGRMNRGIDYRADFYSLGVTFYELLTDELPFLSHEPMDLVHCHIAKSPKLVHEINPQIPVILSEITNKLMAKNAEDRYQSALGLRFDLENCLNQLKTTGEIQSFKIAQRDLCDRFIIPDKLYGRESEIVTLLQAFDRVSQGATELMLVAGFSGIGKTSVINEVHKPIVKQHGYFINGKFDQFERNIPFSAFVQAFRNLISQLLTESDSQIQQWKDRILETLRENAQVIIEVVPELELILGQQPPAPELTGNAAQNRFNLLFQKFTQVFTTAEHPLVIFLDDLQWADSASLKLIQLLIVDSKHLLLIGAYRDNEVSPSHPLVFTLSEIKKSKSTINKITLAPLNKIEVNQLVIDTFKCPENFALAFSDLVYQKTEGNPFFTIQFIKALYQDKLILFDFLKGYWQCDITKINQQSLTSDIIEFMVVQLLKLPQKTQDFIKLSACIGSSFELEILVIVSGQSDVEISHDLWQALQEGLIVPTSNIYKFYQQESLLENQQKINNDNRQTGFTYKFLHDRVQQAAYSLIPDNQKAVIHLKIGQLLRQNLSQREQEEKLFDIVGHLNKGQDLITEISEREVLAQLNLQAGVKARNSTAYAAATEYLRIGIELLQTNCWQTQYELALNLYVTAAEVAYLNGDFESMERIATLVSLSAQTILDKVKIYEIQITAQTSQSKMLEAIAIATDALSQLGIEFPREPEEAKIAEVLKVVTNELESRQIEELVNLPVMTNPTSIAAMQLLGKLFPSIFVGMPSLLPILSSKMVSLSLEFGNTTTSTVGYAIHGMVMCAVLGEVETGYKFGKLALSLLDRFNSPQYKSMTLHLFGDFIQHHREALKTTTLTLKDSYTIGIETGDFLRAGYSIVGYNQLRLFSGVELDTCESELIAYSAALAQLKLFSPQVYLSLTWQTVKNLREPVEQPDCLIGSIYDERKMFPKHHQDHELTAISIAYIVKLMLAYFWGNYSAGINYIREAKPYLMAVSGLIFVPIFHFYAALTYLALLPTQSKQEQAETLSQIEIHQAILHQVAQNAPMNHLHKWYLVEAEKQRVRGEKIAAIECYDKAITLAHDNQFPNEEGLANELAAKFYLDWNKEEFSQIHIIKAYYCYARWGAKAKVNHLEKLYPHLLQPISLKEQIPLNPLETIAFRTTSSSTRTSINGSTSISDFLDFTSILKASQTISSKIELNELITSLNEIILKNSGADKSVLILPQDDILQIRTITSINKEINSQNPIQTLIIQELVDSYRNVPVKIINYVKNTRKTIIIDNCQTNIPGLLEEYMFTYKPQSVLCTPIINQSHLLGILYLESCAAAGVFNQERLQVIHILSTQAAIALENALLYQQMEKALQDLQEANLQIVQSEKMSALGNLIAGVAHEMNNPLGFISATLKQTKPTFEDIVKHLKLYQKNLQNQSDEIISHAEEIDLDYSLQDIPQMLDGMIVACDRLKNISTSLRTFSRNDKDYKVKYNIHEGINSTILILKHRLKYNEKRPTITVVTEYGDLPQIECFPGQLNQVFMNIIANAIDALDESNTGRSFEEIKVNPNKITIMTLLDRNHVKITVADNGKGIREEVKQKIFDYLFTTKGVGKGTGLGLAISRQIIEQTHNGKLSCNSVVGQGTEFTIEIPL